MKTCLMSLACFVILSTACGLARSAEPNAPGQAPPDSVAVTVNGVEIYESRVEEELKPQLDRMSRQMPPALVEQNKKRLRTQILERMVVEQLLDEQIKKAGGTVTEEEVNNQLKQMASQQRPPLSMEDFKAMIEAYGKSFDEVKQRIKRGLSYQKLLEAQWADKINVTEEDAQKYYSENKREFETPEQVRASHILINSDTTAPDSDPNQAKAKAKEKAEDLLKQIKEGADFAELAKANSTCPSAAKGGDLDFFTRGRMVPPFEKAAFKLNVGQISEVVETRFGYHIIKVTDKKQATTKTFDQAKDDIINTLTQTKQGEFAKTYIESLKAEASIVYPPGKEPDSSGITIGPGQASPRPRQAAPPKEKTADE
jgi:peptidyl-prolyl cis-trans isomerase C